jgi:hypothetical protein
MAKTRTPKRDDPPDPPDKWPPQRRHRAVEVINSAAWKMFLAAGDEQRVAAIEGLDSDFHRDDEKKDAVKLAKDASFPRDFRF